MDSHAGNAAKSAETFQEKPKSNSGEAMMIQSPEKCDDKPSPSSPPPNTQGQYVVMVEHLPPVIRETEVNMLILFRLFSRSCRYSNLWLLFPAV